MKKIFVNLISCFIFKKKNRHHFRKKYLKNKKMELKNLCYEIKELNEKINYIENLIKSTTDITKLPPAKGLFRTVQLLNLDILIEIDAICRKHNISYWLDFGTLLGSVRHKGFIPWDDDVDVAMLYDDYIKFQEVIQKEEKNFIFKKYHPTLENVYIKNLFHKPKENGLLFLIGKNRINYILQMISFLIIT